MEINGFYTASEAPPLLRIILRRGGAAIVTVRNEYRLLMHIPTDDRPTIQLPWPLCRIQPHGCSLTISEALESDLPGLWRPGKLIRKSYYEKRSQHSIAIQEFLEGTTPDQFVSIMDRA